MPLNAPARAARPFSAISAVKIFSSRAGASGHCQVFEPENLFAEADFSGGGTVIAAVSGGGDSLALLFLLYDYLKSRGQESRLIAATIDHGLRAESAAEAAYVAKLCAEYGIAHKILLWQGAKPQKGVQAAARAARYALLRRAAEECGAQTLFTAHNLEDRAETYLMRRARLKEEISPDNLLQLRGLACMARESLLGPKIKLLRVLLGVRRAALRAFLTARGIKWLEDPSNQNLYYERARLRQSLTAEQAEQAAAAAAQAGAARLALSFAAAALAQKLHLQRRDEGGAPRFNFDLTALAEEISSDCAPLYLLLALSAALSGGKAYISADNARLRRFLAALPRPGKGEKPLRISLSGAVLEKRRQSLTVRREQRSAPPQKRQAADAALSAAIAPSYDAPLWPFFAPQRQAGE